MRLLLIPLLFLPACASTGMLATQAQLWKEGGARHLASSRPPAPGPDPSPEDLQAWTDWQSALLVAAHTVCAVDEDPVACECADLAVLLVVAPACETFLAVGP
ncbi:MAG TPA: hypothetical protein VEA41_10415 [Salinarimonas sp.]|nr:hypothetical protein [Salinarimonas sp.]